MHQSAFQCLNKECKFVEWKETDISKTRIINMNAPAPQDRQEDLEPEQEPVIPF